MTFQRVLIGSFGLLLFVVYGYRAVTGFGGGFALVMGRLEAYSESDRGAVPWLEKATVGFNRAGALQELADARMRVWVAEVEAKGIAGADRALVHAAARDYLDYLCSCPASGRPWEGLATIYYNLEELPGLALASQPAPQAVEQPAPWVDVGRPGRVAVGLLREAIELSPTWYLNYDLLAIRLGRYGLGDEALEAVRRSAEVLPLYWRHEYRNLPELPESVMEAFAAGAWDAMQHRRPVFMTAVDQWIALGSLEWGRGNLERAAAALGQALEVPGDEQNRAEVNFLLGSVLRDDRQFDRARVHLEAAADHPLFEEAALAALARIASEMDQPERAMEFFRRLRWKDPRNLDFCLRFADAARQAEDWPAAIEALNWARTVHPNAQEPWIALLETHLAMNDASAASSILRDMEHAGVDPAVVERLRLDLRLGGPTASSGPIDDPSAR